MKKIAIIVRSLDAEQTVKDLRRVGVLHVEHQQPPQGKDIVALQEELALVNAALDVFRKKDEIKRRDIQPASPAKRGEQEKIIADWHTQAKHLIDLEKRIEQLEMYAQKLETTISEWQNWGDFEPQIIQELMQKGIYVSLYQIPVKKLDVFPKGAVVKTIFTSGSMAHCIVISQNKFEVPFKEISLPKQSLSQMKKRFSEDTQLAHSLKDEISKMFCFEQDFLKIKQDLEKELELHNAIKGMVQQGILAYIAGYVPADNMEMLVQKARSNQWGIVAQDPSEDDNVPVMLRNPRWVRLIEPVMKLLGIMPGYREIDVSLVFLVFFSIFFGILIGDAGYGLSYLLLTVWFQRKKGINAQNANIFLLFYLLSSCAIAWGILTGSFFGQDWLVVRGIKPLVPALNEPRIMQTVCFFLGALHLTIAHAWRALLKFPTQNFLADLGWIAVLWISYFLARTLILGEAFPAFGLFFAVCGMMLVLFFSEPRRNLLKRLGAGFTSITFGLSFMSAFTDVVSYVRLFAVGLAGVAIANTTNAMAASLGTGLIAFFAGILITIIGHALNIVLGPIAILVHGVRLNVLEFGLNHTSITWSGSNYKPLQENLSACVENHG